jgi:hypothetical protein
MVCSKCQPMPHGGNHEANRRTVSESRMREIRLSGSMRGRHGHGLVGAENQTCLPTLSSVVR